MLKVVAYGRVSTDNEDQKNSYENQKNYWKEYIESHDGWEFIDFYGDEGKSGTNTLKRINFNHMIDDATNKKFDFICTKSVSRFARNTLDCLQYTRKLKNLGIGVFFESDSINTLDKDGELRLTLMATLAQEESRKISENVKWGNKRAMKKGVVYGANRVLGYYIIDKKITVNKEEAKIIKQIFNWFIQGESMHNIVRLLAQSPFNYTKGKMGGNINHTSIKRILCNEKYIGRLKQGKYITEDFLSHKRTKNTSGDYIIIENNHKPIIDIETWNQVQLKLNNIKEKREKEGVGYTKHVWGNKIICDVCGSKFRRRTLKNKDGSSRPVYICNNNYDGGKKECTNGSYLREDMLNEIFMNIFKTMFADKDKKILIKNFIEILEKNISNSNINKDLEQLEKQLGQIKFKKSKLLDAYLDEETNMSKSDYNIKNNELNNTENTVLNSIDILKNKTLILADKKQKLEKLYDILHKEVELNNFNKEFVENYLEKIVVNKNTLKFYLTLGEVSVDRNTLKGSTPSITQPLWVFPLTYKIDSKVERNKKLNIEILLSA